MSALTAEKKRMDVIAQNIANLDTTRTAQGGPYRRKMVVFQEVLQNEFRGVAVKEVLPDYITPMRSEKNTSHPDADEQGFVWYPNVDLTNELINMMNAQRSYQVNISVFNTSREMAEKALELGRG